MGYWTTLALDSFDLALLRSFVAQSRTLNLLFFHFYQLARAGSNPFSSCWLLILQGAERIASLDVVGKDTVVLVFWQRDHAIRLQVAVHFVWQLNGGLMLLCDFFVERIHGDICPLKLDLPLHCSSDYYLNLLNLIDKRYYIC